MDFLQPFLRVADAERITITALETKLGASRGVLSRAINKGTDVNTKWLSALVNAYKQYDSAWILTGIENKERSKNGVLPLLESVEAIAGWDGEDKDGVTGTNLTYYDVPEFNNSKADYLIRISGNSMYPKFHNGDIVACRKISEMNFFQWGRYYVLDTTQGAMIKKVIDSKKEGYIICESLNPEYRPFEIPLENVRGMALVVGSIGFL